MQFFVNLFYFFILRPALGFQAVAARLSTQITNRDATPRVMTTAACVAGMVRAFSATVETVSGDSINTTYRMAKVPSNAVMHSLRLYSDDLGTTTVADVGLYDTTENGGALVANMQALFGSAINLNAGALNGSDILHESGTFDIALVEKALWQVLGLTSDPKKDYDVALTLTAACDGAGTISLKGTYAV